MEEIKKVDENNETVKEKQTFRDNLYKHINVSVKSLDIFIGFLIFLLIFSIFVATH